MMKNPRDRCAASVKPGGIGHLQLLEDVLLAIHDAMSRASEAASMLQKVEDRAEAERLRRVIRDLLFIHEGVRRKSYWLNRRLLNGKEEHHE